MRNPSRRTFIHTGLLAGAGLAVAACNRDGGNGNSDAPTNQAGETPQPDYPPRLDIRGTVIGGGAGSDGQFFVGIIDLDQDKPTALHMEEIGFLAHGFTPRLDRPHVVMVTEKHGKGCLEIDLKARKILRRVETVAGREFYGHSAFSPDGKLWYATEADIGDGSYTGVLAVRDADSMDLREEDFPTHGIAPHDCILIDDGDTLVITNGGGPIHATDEPAGVAYVNVKTGEARRVLKFKTDRINAGHIAMSSKGELVCVSAPRDGIENSSDDWLGAISFYHPDQDRLITADDPIRAKMKGETLSVAFDEKTRVVAATNPAGHIITFWDFDTGKLIKSMEEFKSPRGVSLTLDGKQFVVTHDIKTHMSLIDADSLEPQSKPIIDTSYISGSHNFVFNLPA
ncbi:MAG: DUF1513 domain-containing protein [Planctomycetes bacterium]|nr:DUF1513 domain-containing protein [Planctomycetota bacterium]